MRRGQPVQSTQGTGSGIRCDLLATLDHRVVGARAAGRRGTRSTCHDAPLVVLSGFALQFLKQNRSPTVHSILGAKLLTVVRAAQIGFLDKRVPAHPI